MDNFEGAIYLVLIDRWLARSGILGQLQRARLDKEEFFHYDAFISLKIALYREPELKVFAK